MRLHLPEGGGDSYDWDNGITDGIAFTPSATATYTVTGTDVNGCENTAVVTVTVHDLPTIVANASSAQICIGEEVTLTGSGGDSYVWDNGVTDGVAFAPTNTITYTVTGTDANGCENTAVIDVVVIDVPKPEISVSREDNFEAVLTSSAATGNQWFEEGVLIPDATEQTFTVTDLVDFYTVQVTVDGCLSEMSDETYVYILDAGNFSTLRIWPNPASNVLNIDLGDKLNSERITVHDVAGALVLDQKIIVGTGQVEIDIGQFERGVYFLNIDGIDSIYRFIKN